MKVKSYFSRHYTLYTKILQKWHFSLTKRLWDAVVLRGKVLQITVRVGEEFCEEGCQQGGVVTYFLKAGVTGLLSGLEPEDLPLWYLHSFSLETFSRCQGLSYSLL